MDKDPTKNFTERQKYLIKITDINQTYIKMNVHKYRANLLTNINAVGIIVVGATSVLGIKWLSISLAVLEGISILYAKRAYIMKEECKERYLLLDSIHNLNDRDNTAYEFLRERVIGNSTKCLY